MFGLEASFSSSINRNCFKFIEYNDATSDYHWDEYVDHIFNLKNEMVKNHQIDLLIMLGIIM
jgi:hypothetical protein